MSFVFCLRVDGTRVEDVPTSVCVDWLVAMHPTEPPVPDVWAAVPTTLLPDGIVAGYFNAHLFAESIYDSTPSRPDTDTRPLITPQWVDENPEEFRHIWTARPETCPICLGDPAVWDGPMNSSIPTRCTHWLCVQCWGRIAGLDRRCPLCREDLHVWLQRFGAANEVDDESDDEGDDENL